MGCVISPQLEAANYLIRQISSANAGGFQVGFRPWAVYLLGLRPLYVLGVIESPNPANNVLVLGRKRRPSGRLANRRLISSCRHVVLLREADQRERQGWDPSCFLETLELLKLEGVHLGGLCLRLAAAGIKESYARI